MFYRLAPNSSHGGSLHVKAGSRSHVICAPAGNDYFGVQWADGKKKKEAFSYVDTKCYSFTEGSMWVRSDIFNKPETLSSFVIALGIVRIFKLLLFFWFEVFPKQSIYSCLFEGNLKIIFYFFLSYIQCQYKIARTHSQVGYSVMLFGSLLFTFFYTPVKCHVQMRGGLPVFYYSSQQINFIVFSSQCLWSTTLKCMSTEIFTLYCVLKASNGRLVPICKIS